MNNFSKVGIILFLLALVVVFGPMILIYAVNTLGSAAVAGFAIPYTLDTWFAALLLMFLFNGR